MAQSEQSLLVNLEEEANVGYTQAETYIQPFTRRKFPFLLQTRMICYRIVRSLYER